MTTVCDAILLREMTHTVKIQSKTRTASAGRYKFGWANVSGLTAVSALVQDVRNMESIILQRIGVRATHIVYLPISVDDVDVSITEDNRIVGVTPAEIAGKSLTVQRVLRTPYGAASATKGRHIEVYCLESK